MLKNALKLDQNYNTWKLGLKLKTTRLGNASANSSSCSFDQARYKLYDIVLKVFKGATNYQIVVLAVLGGGSNNQRRSESSCLIWNTGMMRK